MRKGAYSKLTGSASPRVVNPMFGTLAAKEGLEFDGHFAPGLAVRTLTGTLTLVVTDKFVQRLDPGGSARNVDLPAEADSTSLSFLIINTADDAELITVRDDAAATIGTIPRYGSALLTCDGTTWTISRFSNSTAGLTDSSGGTAGATIAAGAAMRTLTFPVNLIGVVAAFDAVTNYVPGYAFTILAWSYITSHVGVGAGASRVFNMEIGTIDVGTTPSTCTVAEATTDTIGEKVDGTTVTGAATGTATDTFSIECANSGTAFTAGSGFFLVRIRDNDLADAIASLAARS